MISTKSNYAAHVQYPQSTNMLQLKSLGRMVMHGTPLGSNKGLCKYIICLRLGSRGAAATSKTSLFSKKITDQIKAHTNEEIHNYRSNYKTKISSDMKDLYSVELNFLVCVFIKAAGLRYNKKFFLLSTARDSIDATSGKFYSISSKSGLNYNTTKGAVDTFDQMYQNMNRNRKIERNLLCLFYNMFNIVLYNSSVLYFYNFYKSQPETSQQFQLYRALNSRNDPSVDAHTTRYEVN